jgi:hypothetical protein
VASLEAEILDIGGAGLADPQTVEAKQYGKGGVVTVVLLGGEQEHAQLGAVETAGIRRVDLGSAHVLGRVRGDAAIDVSEPVEAAHRRQPPVDRRCGKTSRLHPTAVQLDVRARRSQHGELVVGTPLEEAAQVVAVGVQLRPL